MHIAQRFHGRGLRVFEEVKLGSSIIGKKRQVDMLVLSRAGDSAAVLETKFQAVPGTADEKIPYALNDLRALRIPAAVVYAGSGWSEGVHHMLQASQHAVHVEVAPDEKSLSETRDLDSFIAAAFGLWDVIVADKQPIVVTDKDAQ
jgi:hypothetical protein